MDLKRANPVCLKDLNGGENLKICVFDMVASIGVLLNWEKMEDIRNGDIVAKNVQIQIKVWLLNAFRIIFRQKHTSNKFKLLCTDITYFLIVEIICLQITLKLHLKLRAKTKVVIGVVLDGQLRRIAKRIGTRKIARNHAKYAQTKTSQKVMSLNYHVVYNITLGLLL